jgi:hypothetical protein
MYGESVGGTRNGSKFPGRLTIRANKDIAALFTISASSVITFDETVWEMTTYLEKCTYHVGSFPPTRAVEILLLAVADQTI